MERGRQRRRTDIGAESALRRGFQLGEDWSRVGFDWSDLQGPRAKIDEELRELDEALSTGETGAMERELGDVLFAIVNLGRHLGVDAEIALDRTLDRVERRFAVVEGRLEAEGRKATECTIQELEAFWQAAKLELDQIEDD